MTAPSMTTNKPPYDETHVLSKHGSHAKTNQMSGCEDRPSARPAFPTVSGAKGIKHGRRPRIEKIRGLVAPYHPAYAEVQIQGWQSRVNDEMRRDRVTFGGVQ